MTQPFFYCSELSRRASEQPFGTASVGGVWLLVEYPYAWGKHALADSNLSPLIKNHLSSTLARVPHSRLLFIKRERECAGGISFFVVRCREREPFIVSFELEQYAELLEIDVAAIVRGQLPGGARRTSEPLFLVCTHGKRDKCCAKFGYPLYKAMREEAGDAVWQSSHVGGDRFAGNLVCFPHGLFYAHTTEEAGRHAIAEYRRRRLVLDRFRGRSCFAYHVQAAEFFIRSELNLAGLDELRYVDARRLEERRWVVRFMSLPEPVIHEVQVSCRPSEQRSFITCHATDETSVPQFFLDEYRLSREASPA